MNYEPALPLVSLLSRRPRLTRPAFRKLSNIWPDLVVTTTPFVFAVSRYYEEELGYPLLRWWCYRKNLADPSNLPDWKQSCARIEDELRDCEGNRTVNLDPGYLNYSLVVLASFKHDQQKIYLGQSVYADPLLIYHEGKYNSFDWSFPDFKKNTYYKRLEYFRRIYKKLRRDKSKK